MDWKITVQLNDTFSLKHQRKQQKMGQRWDIDTKGTKHTYFSYLPYTKSQQMYNDKTIAIAF